MADPLAGKFVVAISSRALFALEEADAVFRTESLAAYREYQREHEDEPLAPGTGFDLIKALLKLNDRVAPDRAVEVVVMSRNDADSGLRILNSAEAHGLDITRGVFRNGREPWPFLKHFRTALFLSKEPADVMEALRAGVAAAVTLDPPGTRDEDDGGEVRIALDGDAVIFSDESERVYQKEKLEGFMRYEAENADVPLRPGPLKPLLDALSQLQQRFPEDDSPIRTMLVTARSVPAHKRVIRTLRTWGVRIDESFFLGGVEKAGIIAELKPHIYFDDQMLHLERTRESTPAGHVLAVPEVVSGQGELGLLPEVSPPRKRRRKAGTAASTQPVTKPVTAPHPRMTGPEDIRQNVLAEIKATQGEGESAGDREGAAPITSSEDEAVRSK